jgi:hypothetical protein
LLINKINFSIENGFRINSSIIDFVDANNDDELIDDGDDNNDNSKSSISKQVIKILNIIVIYSVVAPDKSSLEPFVFPSLKKRIVSSIFK